MEDAIKGYTGDMLHIRHDSIQPDPMHPAKEIRLHYQPDWLGPQYESKWIEFSDTTIYRVYIDFKDAGDCVSFGWIPHDDAFWKCHATWASKGILGRSFPRQIPGQCQDNGGPSQVSWNTENPGVPQTWGYGVRSDGSLFVEGEEIDHINRPNVLYANKIPNMSVGEWRVAFMLQTDYYPITPGKWPFNSFVFERLDVSPVQSYAVGINFDNVLRRRADKDQIRDLYASYYHLVPAIGISNKCSSYNMDPSVDFVGPPVYIRSAECTHDRWSTPRPSAPGNATYTLAHLHTSMFSQNATMQNLNPIVGQNSYPSWSGQLFTTTVPPMNNVTNGFIGTLSPPPLPIG